MLNVILGGENLWLTGSGRLVPKDNQAQGRENSNYRRGIRPSGPHGQEHGQGGGGPPIWPNMTLSPTRLLG